MVFHGCHDGLSVNWSKLILKLVFMSFLHPCALIARSSLPVSSPPTHRSRSLDGHTLRTTYHSIVVYLILLLDFGAYTKCPDNARRALDIDIPSLQVRKIKK